MTLTEFLLARIAEDEALAEVATPGQWERDSGWSITAPAPEGWSGHLVVVETKQRNDSEFIARHGPTRVLAECEAKRRLIESAIEVIRCGGPIAAHRGKLILYAMAFPYADHADYQEEWKP
jgi:hypothetical protein